MTHNIHLVGSIGLQDSDTVFRTLAEILGTRAKRYPDGETGARHYWVIWQGKVFAGHPGFEPAVNSAPLHPESRVMEKFQLRDGVNPADLRFSSIGYAEEALKSYQRFAELRDAGVIPAGTRFQVSMPTPLAVVAAFVAPDHCAGVEPAYDQAMRDDVETIVANIPNEDLAIQWDVCIEVVAHDGGMPLYVGNPLAHATATVGRIAALIPDAAEVGIHLCYGDPGHKHIVEPKDLGTSVRFANELVAGSPRRLEWIHMAVPRERNDEAYFSPLADLDIGDTELVLGLVHNTDGLEGAQRRMEAARKIVPDFGIATECGFGRRPAESIPGLLQIHVAAAGG